MQKFITHLWFDTEAEDAAKFYTSIFKNSKIVDILYYGESGSRPAGMVLRVIFELDGQEFYAINGGPEFKFNEAISILVNCENQEEIDVLWEKLSEGGEKGSCGWLKDKYGLSWQITPIVMKELLKDPDPDKVQSVLQAMFKMKKIDISALKRAHESK